MSYLDDCKPARRLPPARLANIREHAGPARDKDSDLGPEYDGLSLIDDADLADLMAHVDDLRAYVRRIASLSDTATLSRELRAMIIKAERSTEGP
jgi:hypothetical protein